MKYHLGLIPIILMIGTISCNNLLIINSKNSLQKIRNLNDEDNSKLNNGEEIKNSENTEEIPGFSGDPDNSNNNNQILNNDDKYAALYLIEQYEFVSNRVDFFAYILFHNLESIYILCIDFLIQNNSNNSVTLENTYTLSCTRTDEYGELSKYHCPRNFEQNSTISKMKGINMYNFYPEERTFNIVTTKTSKDMFNDITNQTMKKFSGKDFVYIKNCEFLRKDTIIQIKGETNNKDLDLKRMKLKLDVRSNDGNYSQVDSYLYVNESKRLYRTLQESKDVIIQLYPTKSLFAANLNETSGFGDDTNVFIQFKINANSTADIIPNEQNSFVEDDENNNKGNNNNTEDSFEVHNTFFTQGKNKKGLSKGVIVLIAISLSIALIAFIVFACIMRKGPTIPSTPNLGNMEPKVVTSSSTNIIN